MKNIKPIKISNILELSLLGYPYENSFATFFAQLTPLDDKTPTKILRPKKKDICTKYLAIRERNKWCSFSHFFQIGLFSDCLKILTSQKIFFIRIEAQIHQIKEPNIIDLIVKKNF